MSYSNFGTIGGLTGNGTATGVSKPTGGNGGGLSFKDMLGKPEEKSEAEQVRADFLKEAKKSPIERWRAAYLKAHGLTEESLAALPPEQRSAIEEDMRKALEEAMKAELQKQQQRAQGLVDMLTVG